MSIVSANGQGASSRVLREARVTQVVKDVKILPAQAAPQPATTNDTVRGDTAVRTGVESRAELTFGDLTIARLGANTIFSFNEGSRTVDLANGAILLRVPKNSAGTKIQTAAVTAAITGTTVIAEYHPKSYAKYLVLEGTMRIYLRGVLGESLLLHAGQMMILNPNAKRLPEAVDFDLERLLRTSLFIQGFRPLPSVPLLTEVQQEQLELKAAGELIDTNLVIFGRGTLVTLTDPHSSDVIDRKTAAVTPPIPKATATPSKIGRPPVIANSASYQVAGASVIQTDPSITNPGRTDYGKNYRGPGADANFSTWSFDTTRPFDTSSGFDAFYNGVGVPIAAFKFQSLVLAGNPGISTANGGATFLELIGVDGITSGPPGGTLTFAGIDNLLLAAQNGSILLGPEISFQNIPTLFLYARGTGSNIVLGSPISGTRDLFLDAEGSVQVNGAETVTNFRSVTGGDFLAGTGPVNASTIDIRSGGNLNFTLSQFAVGGTLGGTVTLNAGGAVNIDARGDQTVFNNASSVTVAGQTINLLGNNPTQIDFARARVANFTAGTGGFQAPTVAFNGASLLRITSGANIDVFSVSSSLAIIAATSISAVGDLTAISAITAGTTIKVGGVLGTNFSNITAGQSITAGSDLRSAAVSAGTFIDVGGNLAAVLASAGTNIRVTGNLSPFAGATAGGSITVGGNVGTPGNITAGTTINVGGNFNAQNVTAGQSITVGGNLTATNSATAGTTINVGGTFRAPTATAGGDISANRITLLNATTPGVLRAGGGGITPFIPANPANLLHSLTVSSIVSAGGIDFSGDNFVAAGDGKDGGKLSIFANTITFDAANITSANFNGASGVPTNSAGGSGGQLTIMTTGAITANAPIQATTGLNPTSVAFGGTGGTVSLTSTAGAVNVNSSILVSSNDPGGPAPSPLRRSAAGGTLTLTSG
ncbi:MAG TPA: FecR domain-containing protein, partial [Chthoniobacterales bacterium]